MTKVKLGDVAIEFKDKCNNGGMRLPSVGLEHLIPGEVRLSNWENNAKNTFKKLFKEGHILFGRRRAYQKKASVAEIEGICSGDITVIEAIENKINKELLPFIIQNEKFFDYAISKSAGSLSPRVKWSHLKNFEFYLPDKAKQDKLAEVMWAIEDSIQSYKKLIYQSEQLIKAKLLLMFGTIEENPFNYKVTNLGEACEILNRQRIPVAAAKRTPGPYPYYGANGVQDYIDDYIFDDELILLAEDGGNFGSTTRPIAYKVSGKFWVNNHAHVLKPKEGLDIDYLHHIIRFYDVRKYINGTTRLKLNQSRMRTIKILLPPYEKQKEFSDFVKQVDKSIEVTNKAMDNLMDTKKAIIKKYFG